MMKSLANAVGGKTARACDSCVKKRARWYCAADDAFLCHSCDGSVHSANPLACRHERVRLKTASAGKHRRHASSSSSPPHPATWHQGFTRKARTPRGGKKNHTMVFHDLVPEMSSEDQSYEVEGQLIFEVPVLNPMGDEEYVETKSVFPMMPVCFKRSEEEEDNTESCLNGLFPTEMELAQFSADVETLLGGGTDRELHAMEGLGFGEVLKIEKEEEEVETREVCELDDANETSPFEISFDYESSHKTAFEENDEKEDVMKNIVDVGVNEMSGRIKEEKKENVLMLKLDYETVISTWGSQGTPWTALEPPEIDMLCCPSSSMGESGGKTHHHNHFRGLGLHMREAGDGGREARVSRYREKRRTRLFSKKIRYEVRKLNAEKRPRMKGRFVKRSSIAAAH
ncbi:unnamed protein product [Eruca vesicaria subsp. sativa]|uniref:Uncharacterized protein n=1 Tax=Eruca vesicaria subsp. sativa TaxID=29727 RepID=A0ABC8JYW8_ERUVS|nr:unnamed protein product [Eruca vesicaria subsp. sativa]